MENVKADTQPAVRKRFPWTELALYMAGGFGVFTIASAAVGFWGPTAGLWPVILVVLCNLLFIGGSAWYLGVLRKATTWEEIGIFPIRWRWRWLGIALALSLVLMPLRGLIGLLVSMLVEGGMQSLQNRADLLMGTGTSFSTLEIIVRLVGVGLLVPISEELYFRGMLHRLFIPFLKFWPRVLLSSTLFALAHFDSPGVVVSSFIMAVVIAVAYEKSKSLWMPIAIHATTNTIAVLLLFAATALQNSPLMNDILLIMGNFK